MATRKGINISGTYVVHHNLYAPFSYTPSMYFVFKKLERSDRIVFHIALKTQRPSDTMF